jgi:cytoskeletal protein CcmA (bactofilin family)
LATCGDIVVEATGWLSAELVATNVTILGRVRGPVVASKCVEVGPKAQVVGDIQAPKIVVREGAVIQGNCRMVRPIEEREVKAAEQEAEDLSCVETEAEVTETSGIRPQPLRLVSPSDGLAPDEA